MASQVRVDAPRTVHLPNEHRILSSRNGGHTRTTLDSLTGHPDGCLVPIQTTSSQGKVSGPDCPFIVTAAAQGQRPAETGQMSSWLCASFF